MSRRRKYSTLLEDEDTRHWYENMADRRDLSNWLLQLSISLRRYSHPQKDKTSSVVEIALYPLSLGLFKSI